MSVEMRKKIIAECTPLELSEWAYMSMENGKAWTAIKKMEENPAHGIWLYQVYPFLAFRRCIEEEGKDFDPKSLDYCKAEKIWEKMQKVYFVREKEMAPNRIDWMIKFAPKSTAPQNPKPWK